MTAIRNMPNAVLGHLGLLLLIAGVVVWYLWDTWTASDETGNLIFILPVSIIALVLCFVVMANVVSGARQESAEEEPADARDDARPFHERYGTALLMALFALFVIGAEDLGFDLCAFLFIALALLLQGERRFVYLLVYPAASVALLTYGFKSVVPVPMPTLIF